MSDAPAPIPRFPGGPAPDEPISRDPVDGLGLEAYAGISATLAARLAPRAQVLAGAGLDEARWTAIESTWLLRLASAAMRHDLSLIQAHDEAFAAAQAKLGEGEPSPPLAVYAAVVARIEGGADPASAAASAGLALPAFLRASRAYTARLAADAALHLSFRAMVDAAKASALERPGGVG